MAVQALGITAEQNVGFVGALLSPETARSRSGGVASFGAELGGPYVTPYEPG